MSSDSLLSDSMNGSANFLVLGADTPWVRGLCEALTMDGHRVVGARFVEIGKLLREPEFKDDQLDVGEDLVIPVPPAYGGRLNWLTKDYLSLRLTRAFATLIELNADSWLIATHPVMERWTRTIPDERLIYWNYDDHAICQPSRSAEIAQLEEALIRRSHLVLCASNVQFSRFREKYPEQASRFTHFPNAVRIQWIHDGHSAPDKNTIGYVGTMGDRVDWSLVYDAASKCPHLTFIFVGGVEATKSRLEADWVEARRRALSLPNVVSLGHVPHREVYRYYRSFELGWMPYDACHPFNIACCPTKICDALATGRPFVSTAVPECLLYPRLIPIIRSAAEARTILMNTLAEWDSNKAAEQINFARKNDWCSRASKLVGDLRSRKPSRLGEWQNQHPIA